MSDPLEFSQGVKKSFSDFWAARTPFALPGLAFTPPTNGDPWVRLIIAGQPGGARLLGTSVNPAPPVASQGVLGVEIYVRQGTSLDRAYELANDVRSWMENPRGIPDTVLRDVGPPVEVGPDGTWEQVNVTATFEYFDNRI